jgi:YidC/Oxa1 family membrane protein insertase
MLGNRPKCSIAIDVCHTCRRGFMIPDPLNPIVDVTGSILIGIHAVIGRVFNPNGGLAWILSIVSLAILVRSLTFPLALSVLRRKKKMIRHVPQVRQINHTYKDDKQRRNEETLRFYKENHINPFPGLFLMVVQIGAMISVYVLLHRVTEGNPGGGFTQMLVTNLARARILGVPLCTNIFLSAYDMRLLHITIAAQFECAWWILVNASLSFIVIRLRYLGELWQGGALLMADERAMRKISPMQICIAAFDLFLFYLPFGLIIYRITGNALSLIQEYLFRRIT